MHSYPFAILISADGTGLQITHLPLLVNAERGKHGTLLGHIARTNPHWRHFDGAREAAIIFIGPHAYILPSWYASPHTVPTWNYAAVHAHGRPSVINEKTRARGVLERLVAEHEARLDAPWTMDLAESEVARQLEYIVAFEMEITHLEGQLKFNQNRSRNDREGVIDALAGNEGLLQSAVADAMQAILSGDKKGNLEQGRLVAFQVQQPFLDRKPATETGQGSVGADDTVAGNNDGDRITTVCGTHGTHGLRPADVARELAVGPGLSVRDLSQCPPDGALELGAFRTQWQVEALEFALKISP